MRTAERQKSHQNDREAVCGPKSRTAEIASSGIHTTRDVKRLGLRMAEDILLGELSHKVAGPVCRTITMTLRTAEYEAAGGGQSINLDGYAEPQDDLSVREKELEEELAVIRKERLAKN